MILDIDGTIAGKSNHVSEPVKQAIQAVQAKGIQVAIATGRMYNSALRFHQAIDSQLPIVAYNGAWIQNPYTGEIHQHLPISQEAALQLLDYFEQPEWRSRLGVHFYLDDQLYVRQITSETEKYVKGSGIEAIAVGDLRNILNSSPTKVLAMSEDIQAIKELGSKLPQHYPTTQLHLTQSTPNYLEATHAKVNKGSATYYLAEEILGYRRENVMAIGDNLNDLEMLEYAGKSIAMGNAPVALKNMADWVAPDVEEDGVAIALDKFLL